MPKEGYKSVTIESTIYEQIEAEIEKANEKAGFRKYRSVAQYVEEAVVNYRLRKQKQ